MSSAAPFAGSSPLAASSANGSVRLGYIMTHYPQTAQTFIAGEIDAVRTAGGLIQTFAMNLPSPAELARPGSKERAAETLYLKASALRAVAALLAFSIRHPIGSAQLFWEAVRSGGGSPARILRRLAHLAQAALVARQTVKARLTHLHAHFGLAPTSIAWFASRIASQSDQPVGFSFTIHGFHDFADPAESRLDLKAAAAKAVICISDFTRSQLCLVTPPALWSRYHVIRCGIDLPSLPMRSPRPMPAAPLILAVGRLSAEKGFSHLIEAVAALHADGVAIRLHIVGEGPERAALTHLIEQLNLHDHVTLTGERDAAGVRAELAAADIFCLPSFSEGLPISIMEAMATGVPVVTTWVSGIPELAEQTVTALTVPPARTDQLAAALKRLATERGLSEHLTGAARAKVEHLHDRTRNGDALLALFRTMKA